MLITNNAHQKLTSAITLLFRPKVYRVLSDLEQANSKIISYKKENQFIHSVHDKLILITMRRDRERLTFISPTHYQHLTKRLYSYDTE